MKKSARILSAALAAVMAGSCLAPAALAADEAVTKEETAYITLAPDGSLRTQTVSEWLHSDKGLQGLADRSTLKEIVNLKGSTLPREEDGLIYWDVPGQDVYYQGTTDKTPPVTAQIHYFLDGAEMTAEEITGKSGHLKVTVDLTNREVHMQNIRGRVRPICTPFVTVVSTVLDGDEFLNVKAEDGILQSDGSNQVVGFACLPGLNESLSGLLTGKLDSLDGHFPDSVSFEADVTDMKVPTILIACSTDADALEADDLWADADSLFDDLDELRDATDELLDGVTELLDGVNELFDAVSSDLLDGVTDLHDGVGDLDEGTDTLQDGMSTLQKKVTGDLTDGVKALNDGLGQLTAQNEALNGGANTAANGVLTLVNTILTQQLGRDPGLTWDNYAQVLAAAAGVSDEMRAAAKAQIAQQAGIEDEATLNALLYLAAGELTTEAPSAEEITAAVSAAGAEMQFAQAAASPEGPIGQAKAALMAAQGNPLAVPENQAILWANAVYKKAFQTAMEKGLGEAAAQGIALLAVKTTPFDPADETHQAGLGQSYQAVAAKLGDADDATKALLITMACRSCESFDQLPQRLNESVEIATRASRVQTVLEGFQGGALTAEDPLIVNLLTQAVLTSPDYAQAQGTIASLSQLLAGMQELTAGIKTYTDGVATAHGGSTQLQDKVTGDLTDGVKKLKDGTDELKDGVNTLVDGVDELYDAVAGDLLDGVTELHDGVIELDDGVHEYDEEGISKLTGGEEIDHIKDIRQIGEAMQKRAEGYTSYAGAPEGVSSQVCFVMKTEAPEKAEAEEAPVSEEPEHLSLWQRILNLFRFHK